MCCYLVFRILIPAFVVAVRTQVLKAFERVKGDQSRKRQLQISDSPSHTKADAPQNHAEGRAPLQEPSQQPEAESWSNRPRLFILHDRLKETLQEAEEAGGSFQSTSERLRTKEHMSYDDGANFALNNRPQTWNQASNLPRAGTVTAGDSSNPYLSLLTSSNRPKRVPSTPKPFENTRLSRIAGDYSWSGAHYEDEQALDTRRTLPQRSSLGMWFISAEGIAREVITADIQRYLGPDAFVRPGV